MGSLEANEEDNLESACTGDATQEGSLEAKQIGQTSKGSRESNQIGVTQEGTERI